MAVALGYPMIVSVRRIPILVVIPLALGAVALPWWIGTKQMDFVSPPGEAELQRIRDAATAAISTPRKNSAQSAVMRQPKLPDREVQSPVKPPPAIDPGDPQATAALDAYREDAGKGAAAMIELAAYLEEQSGHHRALLAWERLLDSSEADAAQRAAAWQGVSRLRPLVAPWGADPTTAPLILDAAISREPVPPDFVALLEEAARLASGASAGVVTFTTRFEPLKPVPTPPRRRGQPAANPPPGPQVLSVQILAGGDAAASTGVIELPVHDDPRAIRRELLGAVYRLVASQTAATTELNPPDALGDDEDPLAALGTRVTRLVWSEFSKSLQPAPPP